MADKTTKIIEIEVELEGGEKVTKQFEQLSDGTLKAVDSAKKLDATFDDVYNGMAPLTTRMGEAEDRLYELALAGDTTSQEYQQLLEKVGEYRRTQIQTDLVVDAAATTFTQSLGGALVGVTSGFAALQGAIGLFRTESEELNAALLKVQSSLALAQGVAGVQDAIPAFTKFSKVIKAKVVGAFSTLKKAIITTGIGALVVTLALVADAFDLFADKVDEAAEAQKRLAKENERLSESFSRRQKFLTDLNDSFAKQRKFEIEQLKAQGASREEIYDKEVFAKKRQLENLIELEQEADAEFKRISKISGDEDFKQYDAALENASRFTKLRIEKERELKLFEINSLKERQQAYKDYADKRREIARQIEDLEIEIMDDAMKKELRQNQVKFDRLIEDTKKNTEINAKERKRLIELFLFQQQEAENEIRNRFRREELDAEKANGIEKLNIVDATAKEEVKSTFNMYAAMGKISSDYYKKEKELREKNLQFALNSATEGLDVISSFAQQSADKFADLNQQVLANEDLTDKQKQKMLDKNNKRAKKAFNVQKAASIAAALVTTYQSATQAYASQFLPLPDPSSPVRGGIAAGLAVAAGLANVANISKQKFEGASLGSTQSASTDVGGGAPSFNVVGDSGVNQLAQLQQQPTQAFVVSGEVTTAQALDRNRVQNATL